MVKKKNETWEEAWSRVYYEDRPAHDIDIDAFIRTCKEKDEKYRNSIPIDKYAKTVSTPLEIQLMRLNESKNKKGEYPPED